MLENEKLQDETMIGGSSWRELKVKLKMQWFDVDEFKSRLTNKERQTLDKLEQSQDEDGLIENLAEPVVPPYDKLDKLS